MVQINVWIFYKPKMVSNRSTKMIKHSISFYLKEFVLMTVVFAFSCQFKGNRHLTFNLFGLIFPNTHNLN